MTCDLCGFDFDESKCGTACGGCRSSCQGARCPRCFYEALPGAGASGTLDRLEKRRKAKVVKLETPDRLRLKKILALGVLPGTELTVLQRFPSIVFEIGRSRFSIDRELARAIRVEPAG
ncbi:MAG: ferrous iron transport protein A [Candidatus Omnitrophica bacterium]|nr:ferrous iron transport protein A [Candidatus Omnitrophota bacterium]